MVHFVGLLQVELVDVGVGAVDIGAVLDDEGGKPCRGIAKGSARPLDDAAAVLFAGITGKKAGALDRLQLGGNADLGEVVDRNLGHVRVRAVAVQQAGVEPV